MEQHYHFATLAAFWTIGELKGFYKSITMSHHTESLQTTHIYSRYCRFTFTLAATTLLALSMAWIFHSSRCSKNSILMLKNNKTISKIYISLHATLEKTYESHANMYRRLFWTKSNGWKRMHPFIVPMPNIVNLHWPFSKDYQLQNNTTSSWSSGVFVLYLTWRAKSLCVLRVSLVKA